MRMRLYNFLVNRQSGIRDRYHQMHDQSEGAKKIISYLYLLYLNICYYFLHQKKLGIKSEEKFYEEKDLPEVSESLQNSTNILGVDSFYEQLSDSEIISFDIFDTLIFRPFSDPRDIFWFLNKDFPIQNLHDIRIHQEYLVRQEQFKERQNNEVTLEQIWQKIERETGVSSLKGIEAEEALEKRFCYSNPFMEKVYHKALREGKIIIIMSDMYLPSDFLISLLNNCGYSGFQKLYVSCEYGCSKSDGGLFRIVRQDFPNAEKFVHVGDNYFSDVMKAQKAYFKAIHYPNINRYSKNYRTEDISPIIGGAYRGIVNNHLYAGIVRATKNYEFGFVYGGLFVLGYCSFIHKYVQSHHIEKVLFLSRDGEVLKEVYDRVFPGENTEYVYWSRAAACKLMAVWNRYDYFLRFLDHRADGSITIGDAIKSMELDQRLFGEYPGNLKIQERLTVDNAKEIKKWLLDRFDLIVQSYERQNQAAAVYYRKKLERITKAVAVDIGWAGSGALSLYWLCNHAWGIKCDIRGLIAGTNTIHNAEPYATEYYRQKGKLVSYLYSPADNRDLLKKHNPNLDYNLYWELILSSTSPQFRHFDFDEYGEVKLVFGEKDPNPEGINQIRRGILDFVEHYCKHFMDFPEMLKISGRDAYAPMLVAASNNEKYLKDIIKEFRIETSIG